MSEKKRARVNPPGFLIGLELEERGWSQKDFAEILGMSEQFVSGLIKGERTLTIDEPRPPGLVFGFGAFDEGEIDAAARVLARVLEREGRAAGR